MNNKSLSGLSQKLQQEPIDIEMSLIQAHDAHDHTAEVIRQHPASTDDQKANPTCGEGNITITNSEEDSQSKNRLYGVLLILGATVCNAMMTLLCKLAYQSNPNLTGFDYLLLRSSSMALLSILQVIYLKVNVLDVKPEQRAALLIRWIAGGIGMPMFFIGLKYIPASIWSIIQNTNPILIAIVAFFLLGEPITRIKIFTILGSFTGVALFITSKSSDNSQYKDFYFGIFCTSVSCIMVTWVIIIISLIDKIKFNNFCWLILQFQLRGSLKWVTISIRMANKHMHYALSPFYFGITTYCEAIILLIFIPSVYNFQHYTLYGAVLMILSGVANYLAQTFRSAALKFEDASVISPFSYLQVIYLFIFDLLIFGYSFNYTEILGGSIITVCLLGPEIHTLYVRWKSN